MWTLTSFLKSGLLFFLCPKWIILLQHCIAYYCLLLFIHGVVVPVSNCPWLCGSLNKLSLKGETILNSFTSEAAAIIKSLCRTHQ